MQPTDKLNLPASLREKRIFMFSTPGSKAPKHLRNGRPTGKEWNRDSSWMTYEDAVAAARDVGGQVGLVLSADDDLCCLDIDGLHARSDHLPAETQLDIHETLTLAYRRFEGKTYCERSVSGKGIHVFFRAENLPAGWAVPLDPDNHRGLEFYSANRYVLLGEPLNDCEVAAMPKEALDTLEDITRARVARGMTSNPPRSSTVRGEPLSEDTLRNLASEIDGHLESCSKLVVTESKSTLLPGEYWRWTFAECPNCGEPHKPALMLKEDGYVAYRCFHENRCGGFKIREFMTKLGFPDGPPFTGNEFEELPDMTEDPADPEAAVEDPEDWKARVLDRYGVMTAAELLDMTFPACYLIEPIMVSDQPMLLGGASKTLKTSIAVFAAVSLTTGRNYLYRNDDGSPKTNPAGPKRVLMLSAESGPRVLRETLDRIYDSEWDDDREAKERFFLSRMVPDLASRSGRRELKLMIQTYEPDVVICDPAYMMFSGDDHANMFSLGTHLRTLTSLCQDTLPKIVTPVILHHTTKKSGSEKVLTLNDLAWAGWGQYAGQWWLLSRQEEFDGRRHRLRIQVGNRNGDFADRGCEIVERRGEGPVDEEGSAGTWRVWESTWEPYEVAKARWQVDAKSARKSGYDPETGGLDGGSRRGKSIIDRILWAVRDDLEAWRGCQRQWAVVDGVKTPVLSVNGVMDLLGSRRRNTRGDAHAAITSLCHAGLVAAVDEEVQVSGKGRRTKEVWAVKAEFWTRLEGLEDTPEEV